MTEHCPEGLTFPKRSDGSLLRYVVLPKTSNGILCISVQLISYDNKLLILGIVVERRHLTPFLEYKLNWAPHKQHTRCPAECSSLNHNLERNVADCIKR